MATLNFDFHPLSIRPAALSLALLVVGLLTLGASLFNMQQVNEAHAARAKEVAQLEQTQHKQSPSQARMRSKEASGNSAESAKARVRANLDYSWQPAFAALEATHNPKIALVSLEASQTKKQLRLIAEARRLADAVEYAHQLDQQNGVKRTALLQHEVQEKNDQHPVRFTLILEMRP